MRTESSDDGILYVFGAGGEREECGSGGGMRGRRVRRGDVRLGDVRDELVDAGDFAGVADGLDEAVERGWFSDVHLGAEGQGFAAVRER